MHDAFSLPQCVGYVALVLGVTTYLQKRDDRLKIVGVFQCIAYAIHFVLLHNLPAAASNVISIARNLISLKTKSQWIAFILAAITVLMGAWTIKSAAGFIPITATVIGIFGMFRLQGIKFRLTMLFCTGMWLTNNIISHSIGGMILESLIATANSFTILRLRADSRTPPIPPIQEINSKVQ